MFKKYSINDLYLAAIDVRYPHRDESIDFGGLLSVTELGYEYSTVLLKVDSKYIDLQNPSLKITNERDPYKVSCTVAHIEPLSNYYNQDGTKKISVKKCITKAKKYYKTFNENRVNVN